MTDRSRGSPNGWWRPYDLVAGGGLAIIAVLANQWPSVFPAAVRVVTAGLLCVFVVGYMILEAVFPQTELAGEETPVFRPVERVVLALAFSIVVVPLAALFVDYAPLTLRIEVIVTTVSGLTIAAGVVAGLRRWQLSNDHASNNVGLSATVADRIDTWRSASAFDRALDVIVVVSLLFATVAVAAVPLHDPAQEPYTELTLLTENGSGGLVADEYPQNMSRDRTYQTCLVVGNHERQSIQYTIQVIQEQGDSNTSDGSPAVRTVNRTQLELVAGETRVVGFQIRPAEEWDTFTVRYQLYNETLPPDEAPAPYRMVSFPVTVTNSTGNQETPAPNQNETCRQPASSAV